MGWVQIGFLGALGALAIPILVHLIYGRQARRVELGTLRFLHIVLRENLRRRRVYRWLLLALRLAGVALLAALFARPYLVARQPGGEDRLVVVLIDRSASMGLVADGERLIDAALRRARRVVDQCAEGTQIEIAWFDHAVHPLAGAPAESLSVLASRDTLYGATDYGAALAWAGDIARQSDAPRKDLYLYTDMQRSALERTAPSPLPADLAVHLVELGRAHPDNLAVAGVALSKTTVRPGEALSATVTVRNAGPLAKDTVPVILRLSAGGPAQEFRSQVGSQVGSKVGSQGRVEAGDTATIRFDLPGLAEGVFHGKAMIGVKDDLAFDNVWHFAVAVERPLDVLVVDGAPGESPAASETFFLEAAVRLEEPGKTFPASPFAVVRAAVRDGQPLPALDRVRLVVLANVAAIAPADAQRLGRFVRRGGGLLVFAGDNVRAEGCRALAAESLLCGELGELVRADALPLRLDRWEADHPLLRPFADPQYGDLRRTAFRACLRVTPHAESAVLASFRGGPPALLERRLGEGRILWCTTACDMDWSDWPRSRLYLPLVHQMLRYLSGLAEGGPIREVPLEARADREGGPVPGATAGSSSSERREKTLLDEPAVAPRGPVPGVFARSGFHEVVHFDPKESECERVDAEQLAARFRFRPADETPQQDDDSAREERQAELGRVARPDEIWPWVLLGLFCVLLSECFLANRTMA